MRAVLVLPSRNQSGGSYVAHEFCSSRFLPILHIIFSPHSSPYWIYLLLLPFYYLKFISKYFITASDTVIILTHYTTLPLRFFVISRFIFLYQDHEYLFIPVHLIRYFIKFLIISVNSITHVVSTSKYLLPICNPRSFDIFPIWTFFCVDDTYHPLKKCFDILFVLRPGHHKIPSSLSKSLKVSLLFTLP